MSFFEFPHTRNYDSDLGWLIKTMHEVLDNVEAQNDAIEMYKQWTEEHVTEVERVAADLQNFVNTYFDNLDVQQEINNKITAMAADGSLLAVLADPVRSYVEDWIASYLTPTQPPVDSSLTIAGAAADAKVTGDGIRKLDDVIEINNILTVPDETGDLTITALGSGIYQITGTVPAGTNHVCPGISIEPGTYSALVRQVSGEATSTGIGIRSGVGVGDSWASTNGGKVEKTFNSHTYAFLRIGAGTYTNCVINVIVHKTDENDYIAVDTIARATADTNAEKISEISAEIVDTNNYINVIVPDAFTWKDNPIAGKIKTNYNGAIKVDFDAAEYKNADGVIKYVSPIGRDTNSGDDITQPYLSMKTAYNAGADTIILMPGVHDRANTLWNMQITRSVNIIAPYGRAYITTNNASTMTILSGYTHVWSASRGTLSNVIQMDRANGYDDFTIYTKVDTIEEVEATEGSWAHISGTAYVHTYGDVEPIKANNILLLAGNTTTPLISYAGTGTLYMENVTVFEGSSPLFVQGADVVACKDCEFYLSLTTDNDVCMLQGVGLGIFQDCEASYGMKDGFNYHAHDGVIPKALEINCTGKFNGNVEDGNDQGTTIHDGGSIIRIKDISMSNYGSNYADQGAGTEAWMIGCVGFESKNVATSSQNVNFFAYDGVNMFLDSCIGFGSRYNLTALDTGRIYTRNGHYSGDIAPNMNTIVYY